MKAYLCSRRYNEGVSLDFTLLQDYFQVFFAVVVEAVPFVVLGSVVSGLLAVFVRDEWLLRFLPKNVIFGHAVVALLGFFFPVCECGNLPVAKRLVQKGLPVSQAVTFLLAAPVLNPIVIVSTLVAFRFAPEVMYARVGLSFLIAVGTGLMVRFLGKDETLMTESLHEACEHHEHFPRTKRAKFEVFVRTFREEGIEMTKALALGGSIAAFTPLLPRELIAGLAQSPLLAIVVMMLLALIMSICSTVDAFVALGYVGTFPLSAVLAFLVFGPMIDFRAISLMRTAFRWPVVMTIITTVAFSVLLASSLASLGGW